MSHFKKTTVILWIQKKMIKKQIKYLTIKYTIMNQIPLTREAKLEKVGLPKNTNITEISNDLLEKIYCRFINAKVKKEPIKIKKGKTEVTEQKLELLLRFLNSLLSAMEKDNIKEITDFKNIGREELLKDDCQKVFNEYIVEIYSLFGKSKLGRKSKKNEKGYIITVLKKMVSNVGYSIKSKHISHYKGSASKNYSLYRETYYEIYNES